MKRLLQLPLIIPLALPIVANVSFLTPIYAFPWNNEKPNYIDQEAALDACFDFAKKVLNQRLSNPREQTSEELLADKSERDLLMGPLPSPFKNELGEYKILQYGCKRVRKKNSKKIIPEFRGYIQYLKIPSDKGMGNFKVEELPTSYYWENGDIEYPTFNYVPKDSDRKTGGTYEEFGIDQDWIIGVGFGMAYRLCRETFLHKNLTVDDLKIREVEDKKYLRELFDHSAKQPYPQKKIEDALYLYEGRLADCLKQGDKGWREKTID